MLGGDAGGAGRPGHRPRAARPSRGLARRRRPRPADAGAGDATELDRRDRRLPDLPARRARPRRRRRSGPTAATSPTSPRRAAAARDWARVAGRRRATTSRPGRGAAGRHDPGLAPTSLRRRAAALRGFYRFAFGEGLIAVDVAAHLDLPRPPRLLPETLTVEPRPSGCSTRPAATTTTRTASATGRCSSCCTRPASGSARRSASTAEDLSIDGALRAGHRQGRQGAARAGRRRRPRLARRAGSTGPRPALLALGHVAPVRGGPLFLGDRGRRLARQQAWAAVKRAAARGRPRRTGSARTPCATRSRPICSRAGPTCASSRSCSDMRVSPRHSSTRI